MDNVKARQCEASCSVQGATGQGCHLDPLGSSNTIKIIARAIASSSVIGTRPVSGTNRDDISIDRGYCYSTNGGQSSSYQWMSLASNPPLLRNPCPHAGCSTHPLVGSVSLPVTREAEARTNLPDSVCVRGNCVLVGVCVTAFFFTCAFPAIFLGVP